ncbi:hypothetical protein [Streptomyces sp. TR06-5]|uniref:hypothetical protein n=1 Tax=unclassified Streptomyces TaxID=2593676 RepID=UPI0039A0DA13
MHGDDTESDATGPGREHGYLPTAGDACETWVGLLNDYIAALDMSVSAEEGPAGC